MRLTGPLHFYTSYRNALDGNLHLLHFSDLVDYLGSQGSLDISSTSIAGRGSPPLSKRKRQDWK